MRRLGLAILCALAFVAPCWAAGSQTVTSAAYQGTLTSYSIAWVSDAGGTVSGLAAIPLDGQRIVRYTFVPDTGGTQPTDLYDVTLTDEFGVNLLNIDGVDKGANLSNTTTLTLMLWPNYPLSGASATVTLGVTNAGNAKGGRLIVWVSR